MARLACAAVEQVEGIGESLGSGHPGLGSSRSTPSEMNEDIADIASSCFPTLDLSCFHRTRSPTTLFSPRTRTLSLASPFNLSTVPFSSRILNLRICSPSLSTNFRPSILDRLPLYAPLRLGPDTGPRPHWIPWWCHPGPRRVHGRHLTFDHPKRQGPRPGQRHPCPARVGA